MLLPWNVFITASEYFADRFIGSIYQENFQSYFSTYFTVTNMTFFIYLLWRQSTSSTIHVDVLYPVALNAIIFGIMAVTVETSLDGSEYFWMTLTLMALTGATTSFFQVAVFAEASRFPPQYVQAVMSGQGIAGVAVAASSILSALAGTNESTAGERSFNRSAFIYFLSALLVTIAALVGRVILSQQPFYISQIKQDKAVTYSQELDDHEINNLSSTTYEHHPPRSLRQLIKKSSGLVFSVAYVFVVTLMIFPSITSLIKSVIRHPPSSSNSDISTTLATGTTSRLFDDDIFVALHFLVFNLGDWMGRVLPLWPSLCTFNPSILSLLSGLRTFFIPLFLVCNVVLSSKRHLPVLVTSDLAYFLLIWVFSMTSGWICSLSMMAAPQQHYLRSATEKSHIGSIMSFSLVVGLAIGGCLSFWVRSLL
ncbi:nucleoside transporter-domain-containing protein [Absidia repens]|uniref:Nucleoside transporter-domain-containing protein n=1 Tax=Absidia repens TaxID=90262 RepID=A0A1X2I4K3_9FUNG|nr:nucleoside transporter-domain-containing protein [Absidia repens]